MKQYINFLFLITCFSSCNNSNEKIVSKEKPRSEIITKQWNNLTMTSEMGKGLISVNLEKYNTTDEIHIVFDTIGTIRFSLNKKDTIFNCDSITIDNSLLFKGFSYTWKNRRLEVLALNAVFYDSENRWYCETLFGNKSFKVSKIELWNSPITLVKNESTNREFQTIFPIKKIVTNNGQYLNFLVGSYIVSNKFASIPRKESLILSYENVTIHYTDRLGYSDMKHTGFSLGK